MSATETREKGTALKNKAKLEGCCHSTLDSQRLHHTAVVLLYHYHEQNLGNAEKVRQAIWASFLHCTSTNEKPQHQQYPDGPDSWCFFKRAIADGEQPPPHMERVGTPLSADVVKAVKPIYDRMLDFNVLGRVKHGRTQNAK